MSSPRWTVRVDRTLAETLAGLDAARIRSYGEDRLLEDWDRGASAYPGRMTGRTPQQPRAKRRHTVAQAVASLALAPIMLSVPLATVLAVNAPFVAPGLVG